MIKHVGRPVVGLQVHGELRQVGAPPAHLVHDDGLVRAAPLQEAGAAALRPAAAGDAAVGRGELLHEGGGAEHAALLAGEGHEVDVLLRGDLALHEGPGHREERSQAAAVVLSTRRLAFRGDGVVVRAHGHGVGAGARDEGHEVRERPLAERALEVLAAGREVQGLELRLQELLHRGGGRPVVAAAGGEAGVREGRDPGEVGHDALGRDPAHGGALQLLAAAPGQGVRVGGLGLVGGKGGGEHHAVPKLLQLADGGPPAADALVELQHGVPLGQVEDV
mmetsp:Transcript_78730/g.238781  ORF Transcript_78730/g.238781 Transcript_78730/m.238781 type:complete len:278 (+) Transcript_78730:365-1198(+)